MSESQAVENISLDRYSVHPYYILLNKITYMNETLSP